MRAAIIANPVKIERDDLEPLVRELQPEDWDEPLWIETDADDAGVAAAQRALDEGVDLVLAAGGDGTVRVVADALAGTDVPLALIPAGTGNLLARNLGIDVVFQRAAVRTAFGETERRIDLGRVEIQSPDGERTKHAFAVMAGFGLDAEMIDATDEDLKKKVGWLAYVDAAGRVIANLDRVRVQVQADKRRSAHNVITLVVGNCGVLTNGIVVLPDALIDDGKLDVALVRPRGVRGWTQVIGHVVRNSSVAARLLRKQQILGRQKSGAALGYGQVETVVAKLAEPRTMQVDGDIVGKAIAIRATVEPGVLRVRVPKRQPLLTR